MHVSMYTIMHMWVGSCACWCRHMAPCATWLAVCYVSETGEHVPSSRCYDWWLGMHLPLQVVYNCKHLDSCASYSCANYSQKNTVRSGFQHGCTHNSGCMSCLLDVQRCKQCWWLQTPCAHKLDLAWLKPCKTIINQLLLSNICHMLSKMKQAASI